MNGNNPLGLAGAFLTPTGECHFRVWAPLKEKVTLHLLGSEEKVAMSKDSDGYFHVVVEGVQPGRRYFFVPDNERDYPDPASFFQPEGVHGPSEVISHHEFLWTDEAWKGRPFRDLVLYELHVGTFTTEGTFDAIIPRLDALAECGINAIALMPVAQFPGTRNWGYDGVFPYAVQNSYGGPDGLKRLVNACHKKGMSIFLDVVYNHLGPEGNYFRMYGPYFNKRYWTPWGDAINFDHEWSDGVRDYFVNNALYWFYYFHVDGLRFDAIHTVFDNGAVHFWQLVNQKVEELQAVSGRPLHTIAESDLNSPKTINPPAVGGYGFTAQWLDDFHHALYAMIHPAGRDRYIDFVNFEQLAKAYTDGFVHSGDYVKFRRKKYGASSAGIDGNRFVVFNLNHDQVGNRPLGERLSVLVDFERLKLAAAALMFAPYIPMLFMGEEYGERAPFYYFVSHSDPALIEAVRQGRREEFREFSTMGESPDPQDVQTFNDSRLQWHRRSEGEHAILLNWHRRLISLRNELAALKSFRKDNIRVHIVGKTSLVIYRQLDGEREPLLCLLNFSEEQVECVIPFHGEQWNKVLDSRDAEWLAAGNRLDVMPETISFDRKITLLPLSAVVYRR